MTDTIVPGWTDVTFEPDGGREAIPADAPAIALTTAGPERGTAGSFVADSRVYELRAWTGSADTWTEHRWVNGLGLATVAASTAEYPGAQPCWLIGRVYRARKGRLHAREVFQAGDYGNVHLVDEIIVSMEATS